MLGGESLPPRECLNQILVLWKAAARVLATRMIIVEPEARRSRGLSLCWTRYVKNFSMFPFALVGRKSVDKQEGFQLKSSNLI